MTPEDQIEAIDQTRSRMAKHLDTVLSTAVTEQFADRVPRELEPEDAVLLEEPERVLAPEPAPDRVARPGGLYEPPTIDPDRDLLPGYELGVRATHTELRAALRDTALACDLALQTLRLVLEQLAEVARRMAPQVTVIIAISAALFFVGALAGATLALVVLL